MTPQLVDHARSDSCIVIGSSWLQPRRKMSMFISGCSHITVIIAKNAFVRQPISPYRLDIYCLFASPLSSLNEHIRSYLLHTWQSQMNWPTLALKVLEFRSSRISRCTLAVSPPMSQPLPVVNSLQVITYHLSTTTTATTAAAV